MSKEIISLSSLRERLQKNLVIEPFVESPFTQNNTYNDIQRSRTVQRKTHLNRLFQTEEHDDDVVVEQPKVEQKSKREYWKSLPMPDVETLKTVSGHHVKLRAMVEKAFEEFIIWDEENTDKWAFQVPFLKDFNISHLIGVMRCMLMSAEKEKVVFAYTDMNNTLWCGDNKDSTYFNAKIVVILSLGSNNMIHVASGERKDYPMIENSTPYHLKKIANLFKA
jgi:hypothetical protein